MRLDRFLKNSCLVTRRTLANRLCDAGLVKVNNVKAKPSREVKIGDVIELKLDDRIILVRVVEIPERQVSKKQARELYEVLSQKKLAPDELS
ncbi:MAG: RNA-binding S4 domain-containing protein [Pyrinomonadaceae bacterium]|nr:RNA-binding S4 domain-containing protein [Pyrinomonadaceae bacterium]MCX7639398.1 RNA-binding S4 domain-containing protein [Pyrinomonadaceae bacterium]MDW8304552.1 RNA-binding S4 domain-containing protein [Acidobacteriota bacterium]